MYLDGRHLDEENDGQQSFRKKLALVMFDTIVVELPL